MIAAPRTALRVLFAGVLLLLTLPLTAGTAAAAPSGSPSSSAAPTSPTPPPVPPVSPVPPVQPAPPPAPPGGTVTATATVDCAAQAVVVAAHNTTAAAVSVGAFLNQAAVPAATLDVAAGDSAVAAVKPGDGPFQLTVRRLDTSAVLATAEGFFSCPVRHDLAVTVHSGVTYTSDEVCAVVFFLHAPAPQHGTAKAAGRGFTYTSVGGYTGPDQFDYECGTSESVFGTVKVTVLPPPVATPSPVPTGPAPAVTPPPAARPQLPETGTGHLPVLLGAGLGLVAAGALTLRLARRS